MSHIICLAVTRTRAALLQTLLLTAKLGRLQAVVLNTEDLVNVYMTGGSASDCHSTGDGGVIYISATANSIGSTEYVYSVFDSVKFYDNYAAGTAGVFFL